MIVAGIVLSSRINIMPVKQSTRLKPNEFSKGVAIGLRRAAKDARKIAKQYGTPIYVWRDGKVVAEKP
jgi:hypothetical protein